MPKQFALAFVPLVFIASSVRAQPASTPATEPTTAAAEPTTAAAKPTTAAAEPTSDNTPSEVRFFDRIRLGARLGANFASIATEPDDDSAFMRGALNVGAFATMQLGSVFELELGIGYSQRGFNLEPQGPTQSGSVVKFDYFEAPTLVRARIPWGKTPMHIRLAGGLNLLVLDAARSSDNDEMNDIEDDVTGADLAIVLSAGMDFSFSRWLAIVDFRYDAGLINTVKNPAPGFAVYNRVASINAGFAF